MKRAIFVGQAMPRVKLDPHHWPTLNAWLYSIGLTHEQIVQNFCYSALVDYFPGSKHGSHLVPTHQQIIGEQTRLKNTISEFDPEIVIPVGRLSIAYCFNEKSKPLTEYIGSSFEINPYGLFDREILVIPFPHPSGASTWRHKKENKIVLQKALDLLKQNLA